MIRSIRLHYQIIFSKLVKRSIPVIDHSRSIRLNSSNPKSLLAKSYQCRKVALLKSVKSNSSKQKVPSVAFRAP